MVKRSTDQILIAIVLVEHCKYTCPGGATDYLGGCHCLSGRLPLLILWSNSDNTASLSSSEAVLELPTGTELGKNYIQNKFLD